MLTHLVGYSDCLVCKAPRTDLRRSIHLTLQRQVITEDVATNLQETCSRLRRF